MPVAGLGAVGAGTSIGTMNVLFGAQDNATPAIASLGKKLAGLAGMAVVIGVSIKVGKESIRGFVDLDKAVVKAAVMFDDMGEATQKVIRETAVELSQRLPVAANDVADAFWAMGSAGMDTTQAIAAMNTISRFAIANDVKMKDAAFTVAQMMTMYGFSAEEVGGALDIMTMSMKSSLMEMGDLMEALETVGGTAATMGVTIEDLSTTLAMFAGAGVRGSEAGTAMRRILLNLAAPTKDQQEVLKYLGVSIYDDTGKMKELQEIMIDLRRSTKTLTEEERNYVYSTIGGARAVSALSAVMGLSDDQFDSMYDKITNADGAMEEMAETAEVSASAKMEILKNQVEALKLKIGEALVPGLLECADTVLPVFARALEALMPIIEGICYWTAKFCDWLVYGVIPALQTAIHVITMIGDMIKNVFKGIADAITDFFSFVPEGIGSVLKGIGKSITSFFKIGSPSKLTEGWGKSVIQGFQKGLDAVTPTIPGISFGGIEGGGSSRSLSINLDVHDNTVMNDEELAKNISAEIQKELLRSTRW